MSSLVIGPLKERLEFQVTQVDLLAGTTQSIVCPVDGFIDGMDIIVETAITTGGTVALQGGGAVYNLQSYLDTSSFPLPAQGDTAYLPAAVTFTATAFANTAPTATGIVTFNNHGLVPGQPVKLGGTVPTGFTTGNTYYVSAAGLTANGFNLSSTAANAFAGTSITASGSASTTATVTTGQQGTIAVTNLSQAIPNSATKGTIYALNVPAGDPTNLVLQGQLLQLTLASFATAGAINGFIRFRSNR